MAIRTVTAFRGIELTEAYIRIFRLEVDKDQCRVTGHFQVHASEKKDGALFNVYTESAYIPDENPFDTAFRELKLMYDKPIDC